MREAGSEVEAGLQHRHPSEGCSPASQGASWLLCQMQPVVRAFKPLSSSHRGDRNLFLAGPGQLLALRFRLVGAVFRALGKGGPGQFPGSRRSLWSHWALCLRLQESSAGGGVLQAGVQAVDWGCLALPSRLLCGAQPGSGTVTWPPPALQGGSRGHVGRTRGRGGQGLRTGFGPSQGQCTQGCPWSWQIGK